MNKDFNLEAFKIAVKIGILMGQHNPNIDPDELTETVIKLQTEAMRHEMQRM